MHLSDEFTEINWEIGTLVVGLNSSQERNSNKTNFELHGVHGSTIDKKSVSIQTNQE